MWYSETVMQEVHLIKQVPLPCSANDTSTLSWQVVSELQVFSASDPAAGDCISIKAAISNYSQSRNCSGRIFPVLTSSESCASPEL